MLRGVDECTGEATMRRAAKAEVTAAAVAIGMHGPNCWLLSTAVARGE